MEEVPPVEDNAAATVCKDDCSGAEYAIRVAVRVRPLLAKEQEENAKECVSIFADQNQVVVGKNCFTFDHAFGSAVPQEQVYEEAALPLIEGLGSGLNATLLAYGQTSAGKTFTLGSSNPIVPKEQQGIIPRFVNAFFRDIVYAKQADADVSVRVSFIELHNEDINDLLDPKMERMTSEKSEMFVTRRKSVNMREDPQQGVVIAGTKEVEVRKPAELLRCLEKGSMQRTTAATQMNEASSRSHAIFSVLLERRSRETGEVMTAKVRFADLAGSERVKKSGTIGERFKEGVSINQGLLALGNVISALGDPRLNRSHVPYRDSKLTRMLQDSLGGNSRTLMIACVSPAFSNLAETLNTLKYANRAKNIKNKVSANIVLAMDDPVALRDRIQALELELQRERRLRVDLLPGVMSLQVSGNEESPRVLRQELTDTGVGRIDPVHVESLEQENRRLRQELAVTKQRLVEAAEEALRCREKLQEPETPKSPPPKARPLEQVSTPGPDGPDACAGSPLFESPVTGEAPITETDKVSDLDLKQDPDMVGLLKRYIEEAQTSQVMAKETSNKPSDSLEDAEEDAAEAAVFHEAQERFHEELAHAEEDAREEEEYQISRREMEYTIEELDELIREKVDLMEQLSRQSRAFHSMKARYELRL
mmetsp:Transcript_29299/g.68192  ORF Transcript_29299/g.68192 Transcript_29299/m.68192 type:complete len:651 (+) Transcript_29299:20-1972(+)